VTAPAPQAQAVIRTPISRILLLVAGALFILASLNVAFGWSTPPWAFGFGAFAAWALGMAPIAL
jgi:hypothetical protein